MKRIAFLICLLLITVANKLNAFHNMGGTISYRILPSGQCVLRAELYRDCSGPSMGNMETLRILNYPTPGQSTPFSASIQTSEIIGANCYNPTQTLNCVPGTSSMAVEKRVYETVPITLTGSPGPDGWIIYHDLCCVDQNIDNILTSGISTFVHTIIHPVYDQSGTLIPFGQYPDDSPRSAHEDWLTRYTSEWNSVDSRLHDADGDSLHYYWEPVYSYNDVTNIISIASYEAGYAYDQPLPGITHDPANIPPTLHPITGEINFLSHTAGKFIYCIGTEAWRGGQLLCTTRRTYSINIINSTNPDHVDPTIALIQGSNGIPLVPLDTSNRYLLGFAQPGDSVVVFVSASDTGNHANLSPQVISLNMKGSHLGSGCKHPPCAVASTPGSGFTGTDTLLAVLRWQLDSSHFQPVVGFPSGQAWATFSFETRDDECRVNGSVHGQVIIGLEQTPWPIIPPNNPPVQPPYTGMQEPWDSVLGSPVGTDEFSGMGTVAVGPNPVGRGSFRVTASGELFGQEIVLVDVTGRRLENLVVLERTKSVVLDWTAHLPEGVYFLIIGGEKTLKLIR